MNIHMSDNFKTMVRDAYEFSLVVAFITAAFGPNKFGAYGDFYILAVLIVSSVRHIIRSRRNPSPGWSRDFRKGLPIFRRKFVSCWRGDVLLLLPLLSIYATVIGGVLMLMVLNLVRFFSSSAVAHTISLPVLAISWVGTLIVLWARYVLRLGRDFAPPVGVSNPEDHRA